MEELIIKPSDLRNGLEIERVIESVSLKSLEQDLGKQNLNISFKAQLISQEVLVTGNVKGEVTQECFSCNERFLFPLELNLTLSFPASVEIIDLEEEIRQLVLLSLPNKPSCRENCSGLCPKCGKNLNQGACGCKKESLPNKWGKLKDLLNNK